MNDNLFGKAMLEGGISLQKNAKRAMHTLNNPLSYYLGKLKSLYSVDGNIEREQVWNRNHSVNTPRRIMEEYQNRLFFYYIIGDKLPHSRHDSLINVIQFAFILFINELVTMEDHHLNRCELESGTLRMEAQG
ncbi:hypothetical protein C922_05590 [Plasmodium inui San Antonio 1]|uniref:Plasmodium RESA N-terminal domain-containing protein n=1 Tax=Plasmodium inui San Antonio 1 TaxID=1237626 RepID=W6ZXR2_9APIC|nr:hypothetical protein C922_05590 [Plasmodium inui San Antonio 1]EUD64030.1 hypothetical protein C922_05590 [Plasmodium inui San Antonio 1]